VTSFRFFWDGYTPEKVSIDWKTLNHFAITFDQKYVATADWHWGREAVWAMTSPPGVARPGEEP
jgi:hypothetical protein